jgi:hypothetical protein
MIDYPMSKSERMHWLMMDKIQATSKAKDAILPTVPQNIQPKEMTLEQFEEKECRNFESKEGHKVGSVGFKDVLYDSMVISYDELLNYDNDL